MDAFSSMSIVPLHFVVLSFLALRVVYTVWIRNRLYKRPPGPHPIPFLGNVHQLPADYQPHAIRDWGKKFGDLIYARFFNRHTIMINSLEVAQDLLEKRGANYSDRPPFILHTEIMGWDSMLVHARYDDKFRKARKWTHEFFSSKSALKSYASLQMRETYVLVAGLFESPEAFAAHFARFTAATVTEITYGHTVTSKDDPLVRLADEATSATVEAGSPASMLVDFIPILKHYPTWLPGAGWKRRALAVRGLARDMVNKPFELVKQRMAAGTAQPSFVSNLLEQLSAEKGGISTEDEYLLKCTAATLYGAGVETTQNVFTAFILAMARNPHVLKKVQEEMDRVVGHDRLPDLEDRDSLPYLESVIKETMRWHPPTPLGIPHFSMKDDVYNGYVIPAKSLMIANIWAITQNPDDFPNPQEFIPERYTEMSKERADYLNPRNFVFGFGRRLCPARHFADINMYLAIACMAATLDITKARDEEGNEITPSYSYKSGFVHHIHPFKCVIRPRSQKVSDLLYAQLNASS